MADIKKIIRQSRLSKGELYEKTKIVDSKTKTIFDMTDSVNGITAPKTIFLENTGKTAINIAFKLQGYSDDVTANAANYIHFILGVADWMYMPTSRIVGGPDSSLPQGTLVENVMADVNLKTTATATLLTNVDSENIIGSTTGTRAFVAWTSALDNDMQRFYLGDLIQLSTGATEIMRVVGFGDGSSGNNCYLIVERGLHGTNASASHAATDIIYYPEFNAYQDYDKTSGSCQTDASGNLELFNLFGLGRGAGEIVTGILPGSISIKFYSNKGYQALGVGGMAGDMDSGLAANTLYSLGISVDAGDVTDISFTTDASDTTIGNVLSLINTQLKVERQTAASGLLYKNVTVGIVDGDVRFISHSHLSTSTIVLSKGVTGTGLLDTTQIGIFPPVLNLEASVVASIPTDYYYNEIYEQFANITDIVHDNGHGALYLNGQQIGSINYESGALNLQGVFPEAPIILTCSYNSFLTGGVKATFTANTANNVVEKIYATSSHEKLTSKLQIRVEN